MDTVYNMQADKVGHYKGIKVKNGIYVSLKFTAPEFKPFELGPFRLKKGSS